MPPTEHQRPSPVLRTAREEDREAVLSIRADAIRTGTALWTDTVPTPAGGARWFTAQRAAGPFVVAEADGEVVGFANVAPLRPYDGYRRTGEDSVYLTEAARGRGLGRALLEALIERSREAGFHSLVGNIEAENAASVAVHERCGFAVAGRLPEAGWKFGRWLDLVIMHRPL